jgi:hypothetical protein
MLWGRGLPIQAGLGAFHALELFQNRVELLLKRIESLIGVTGSGSAVATKSPACWIR